jgi:hypothetical protein
MSGHTKWELIKHKKELKSAPNCKAPAHGEITLKVPYCTNDTDPSSIAFHAVFASLFRYIEDRGGIVRYREYVQESAYNSVADPDLEEAWLCEARTLNLAEWYRAKNWNAEDPTAYQKQLARAVEIRQVWWI